MKFTILVSIVIFFLALILRTVNLESLPYGFHVDEAKAAWNAYSILKTAHDDQGIFWPQYYNSFGDFRPAGIFYLIIPSLLVFGNTVIATRLPAALFGALTVFPLMLIFGQIAKNKDRKWFWLAGLFLAINPWHIMVSRATSEVVIALFLSLLGIYFFIKSINRASWKSVIVSLIFIGSSYFFYHSVRILVPIFLIAIAIFYWPKIKVNQNVRSIVIIIIGSILLTVAFLRAPQARGRMTQVSMLNDPKILLETVNMPNQEGSGKVLQARSFHNRPVVVLRSLVSEYTDYFGINFLTGDAALPTRYRIPNFGLITYVELLLIALSLAAAATKKEVWLVWLLLIIAPLPAAVTNEDIPNLHRALFMVPFLVLLEVYGLIFVLSLKKRARLITTTLILAWIVNWIYFGHFYWIHQKFGMASYYRDAGYSELASKIYAVHDQYAKVIVTNSPDDVYPWFEFFNKTEIGSVVQTKDNEGNRIWTWKNIIFSNEKCPSKKIALSTEKSTDKILIIDGEGCELDGILAKKQKMTYLRDVIRRPDFSEAFLFIEKNK